MLRPTNISNNFDQMGIGKIWNVNELGKRAIIARERKSPVPVIGNKVMKPLQGVCGASYLCNLGLNS